MSVSQLFREGRPKAGERPALQQRFIVSRERALLCHRHRRHCERRRGLFLSSSPLDQTHYLLRRHRLMS